jgi:hypothetical protein
LEVLYRDLPRRFATVHWRYIGPWLLRVQRGEAIPHLYFIMREPLGSVHLSGERMEPETVSAPCVRATKLTPGTWEVAPDGAGSAKLIHDWTVKHHGTTDEDFDWHPFKRRA